MIYHIHILNVDWIVYCFQHYQRYAILWLQLKHQPIDISIRVINLLEVIVMVE